MNVVCRGREEEGKANTQVRLNITLDPSGYSWGNSSLYCTETFIAILLFCGSSWTPLTLSSPSPGHFLSFSNHVHLYCVGDFVLLHNRPQSHGWLLIANKLLWTCNDEYLMSVLLTRAHPGTSKQNKVPLFELQCRLLFVRRSRTLPFSFTCSPRDSLVTFQRNGQCK